MMLILSLNLNMVDKPQLLTMKLAYR